MLRAAQEITRAASEMIRAVSSSTTLPAVLASPNSRSRSLANVGVVNAEKAETRRRQPLGVEEVRVL
jgi:hypothetical protein